MYQTSFSVHDTITAILLYGKYMEVTVNFAVLFLRDETKSILTSLELSCLFYIQCIATRQDETVVYSVV